MQLEHDFTDTKAIGEITKSKLKKAGIKSTEQLVTLTPEEISKLKGFDSIRSKNRIDSVKELTKHNGSNGQDSSLHIAPYETELMPKFEVNLETPSKMDNPVEHVSIVGKLEPPEDKDSEIYHKEMLSKPELILIRNFLIERFKALGFSTLRKQSSLLRRLSNEIDFLAYKIEEVNQSVGLIVFFPVKISKLKGVLLVSDQHIAYQPTNKLVDILQETLESAHQQIFRGITKAGTLFQLIRQKLGNKKLFIQKTKNGTPLFIASAQKQYKPVIHPVLVSLSEPASLEKITKFAYQRSSNVHIIKYKFIEDLVKFLEKKEILRESFILENAMVKYSQMNSKLINNLQKFSIPVLTFGALFGGTFFLKNPFLLATFTNLGIATLILYGVTLWFVYRNFQIAQKTLKAQFSTPRYLLPVEIDEIGILSIKDSLRSYELDQLIYEWFGKSCEFSCINDLETEKILEEKEKNIDINNSPIQTTKDQMISKYSSFLED